MPDFTVENHISVFLLRPNTVAARKWVTDHIPSDALMWGDALVIEPRYIADIVEAIVLDGLSVA